METVKYVLILIGVQEVKFPLSRSQWVLICISVCNYVYLTTIVKLLTMCASIKMRNLKPIGVQALHNIQMSNIMKYITPHFPGVYKNNLSMFKWMYNLA